MATLLRIDSSIRLEGSESRLLADRFQARWEGANPGGTVLVRDLQAEPVPALAAETAAELAGLSAHTEGLALSDRLIAELQEVDELLISSPVYNLSLSSGLKAYFDHVVRAGHTFEVVDGEYRGLLGGKKATVLATSGGPAEGESGLNLHTGYLRSILAFIGIDAVDVVSLNGTAFPEAALGHLRDAALAEIDAQFGILPDPAWTGTDTEHDRSEIATLRNAQADAIVSGDATAYAELCVEGIQLAIPGQELVSGQEQFIAAERALFERATFRRFLKRPTSVHVSGDLAVEVGVQEVTAEGPNAEGGVFSSRQKYVHVMQRTSSGWRYNVLSSNSTE